MPTRLLSLLVTLHALVDRAVDTVLDTAVRIIVRIVVCRRHRKLVDRRRLAGDVGQATTEYALVLLAAALVALLVVAWATAGGGAARISRLFNRVIDAVIDRV